MVLTLPSTARYVASSSASKVLLLDVMDTLVEDPFFRCRTIHVPHAHFSHSPGVRSS